MRKLFIRDAFDIAPHAQKLTKASWLVFGLGLMFAAMCLWILINNVNAMRETNATLTDLMASNKVKTDGFETANHRQNNPSQLERERDKQQVQRFLRMSWTGLFDVLEIAAQGVRGGVTILTLVPSRTQPDVASVNIVALAANPDIMLRYIALLQKDFRIRQVEIATQQPDDKAGPEVVRFQLSVAFDPLASAASPSAPSLAFDK